MAVQQRTPPYAAYAAIMGTFAGALAAAGALGRLLDRACRMRFPDSYLMATTPSV